MTVTAYGRPMPWITYAPAMLPLLRGFRRVSASVTRLPRSYAAGQSSGALGGLPFGSRSRDAVAKQAPLISSRSVYRRMTANRR